MRIYTDIVNEVITSPSTIREVAIRHGVGITTLATHVKKFLNIQSVDTLLYWINIIPGDIRKIFSTKDKTYSAIWMEIKSRTLGAAPSAGLRERLYYIKHNLVSPPVCGCGSPLTWNTTTMRSFNTFCNAASCAVVVDHSNRKREATNLRIRGVSYAYLDPKVRQKRNQTMLEKYGCTSYTKSHISSSALQVLSSKDDLQSLYDSKLSTFAVADSLGVSQSHVSKMMSEVGAVANSRTSEFENSILLYIINQIGEEVGSNRRLIFPQELDIYIPSRKLAFECNGIYWHSERYKSRNYHLDKTTKCKDIGVRLVHIFENEYISSRDIVQSRISSMLGTNNKVAARSCEIRPVSFKQADRFFDDTHIQGGCKTMSIIMGLYHRDELVACMGLGKARFSPTAEYELVRYSSKLYTNVIGGASKLFKSFTTKHPTSSIVTYSDERWNTGNLYRVLGFTYSHTSSPNYFYFKDGYVEKLMSRVQFQKHKLKDKLPIFNSAVSEYSNMRANGYDRIWDCGNSVWIYKP